MDQGRHLDRLLRPRSVAYIGGAAAQEAVRQSVRIGYPGQIWPVHPTRPTMAGIPCWPDVRSLPGVPDAAFVSVPREETIRVVAALAALGAGGVVCHASGFAEDGAGGRALQEALVTAAGGMALVGPNCLGLINYLDRVALWCDQQGAAPVERGPAIISQSGNIALNLTMQRRSLPLSYVITVGNCASTSVAELMAALLQDDRVTAIGLHLEELPDAVELAEAAMTALRRRVPVVALKSGTSELGRHATSSHTSALATPDAVSDGLFRRLGIARVRRLESFVETLKLLHVHGALPGARVTSASCSGGEAAHVADLAESRGVTFPPLLPGAAGRLREVLGDRVPLANPLDYHTYIWGDRAALTHCFSALQSTAADAHLLLLDLPRQDRCTSSSWEATLDAFTSARTISGARACVVSSLPEGLPELTSRRLLEEGIAPMQGVEDCLTAVASAREIGAAQVRAASEDWAPQGTPEHGPGGIVQLDEVEAKRELARCGVSIPQAAVVTASEAREVGAQLGYPLVAKAVSATVAHKSEVGAVHVGLTSEDAVEEALSAMRGLGERFLLERMVEGAVAELLVGVRRDPKVGLTMTVGAGGVLVELLRDSTTLVLPATREDIVDGLQRLRQWPLLTGFRGRTADLDAAVRACEAIGRYACSHADRLLELEVNPLLVLPEGAVAVDALIMMAAPDESAAYTPRIETAVAS